MDEQMKSSTLLLSYLLFRAIIPYWLAFLCLVRAGLSLYCVIVCRQFTPSFCLIIISKVKEKSKHLAFLCQQEIAMYGEDDHDDGGLILGSGHAKPCVTYSTTYSTERKLPISITSTRLNSESLCSIQSPEFPKFLATKNLPTYSVSRFASYEIYAARYTMITHYACLSVMLEIF